MRTKLFTMALLVLATFLSVASFAQSRATEFEYLVNAKGSSAEMELENKGYIHMKTDKSGYSIYSYWWSPGQRKCVTTMLSDGRVMSVINVPAFDCNQRPSNAGNDYAYHTSNYNQHQAHHHESNNYQHYNDGGQDIAFERGFRDGVNHYPYHNIFSSQVEIGAYSSGYNKGVSQRTDNSSYHSGQGGYAAHVNANDILHKSENHGYAEMQKRGFAEVRRYTEDGKIFVAWYSTSTRQCVKTVAKSGSIIYVKMNSAQCN